MSNTSTESSSLLGTSFCISFLNVFILLRRSFHTSRKVETKWSCCCFCVTEFNPVFSALSTAGVVWLPEVGRRKVDAAGTNSPATVFSHIVRCFFSPIYFLPTILVKELWIKKNIFGPNTRITLARLSHRGGEQWRGISKRGDHSHYILNGDALWTSALF